MTKGDPVALLEKGLQVLGLTQDEKILSNLIRYIELIQRWNKAYNLTAIDALDEMVVKHLLDSLAVMPYLHGEQFVDVGSGAGLPAIPLAMYHPERTFYLVEPNAKKCQFLELMRIRLAMPHVIICKARIEDVVIPNKVDGVISRAFTQLEPLYEKTKSFLNDDGYILAMKGSLTPQELEGMPEHVSVIVKSVEVPYLDAIRHVVLIKDKQSEKNNISQ